jgi:prepilin signal peptidase PulO-like enzyme (type II secretory pathway)
VLLVVVSLALYRRLAAGWRVMAQTATAVGLIWAGLLIAAGMVLNIGFGTVVDLHGTDPALAESTWLAVDTVGNGLSGGMEIFGPIWVLLISFAALRTGALPKALNYLGIVMAVAGLATIIPALEAVGAIFGLGLIVWLSWVGVVLYRGAPAEL